VISGHVVIAFMLTIGGVWHCHVQPFAFARKLLVISAESILSYSIGAVALMGFVASIWCASNTTVYPEDFFGPALNMKFSFSPYFADSINLPLVVHTARAWLANAHFFLAFFFLQGHFWHGLRSLGFDFRNHLRVC
jgi:chlorophyll a/b binding light-harvesting protein PcbD